MASGIHWSKYEFQPKLNLAGSRGRARDFARSGTETVAGKDDRVRKTEVSSVRDVKKFGPKLHTRPFRDTGALGRGEIEFR